jgi:hypothetical protein
MASDLKLTYKAHVYQKTGVDWDNVKITLSTGSPSGLRVLPELGPKHLNFVSIHSYKRKPKRKQGNYSYNPSVKKVTGVVRDENGFPLPGVNVVIEGTSQGTTTDFDGKYELEIASGQNLMYTYIGMHDVYLPIYSSLMNVSMEEDAQSLDEVVVTGYGRNAESALAGRVAGVQIRGAATSSIPAEPLYIIDGIPNANYSEGDLDENSIQDIEILKGNAATALYGS